jgi:8-amino-7-oxononanoate synthase
VLAQAFHAPAALLFNSGYHANIGVLSTVVGEGDVIFSDASNHASIIDGCRLSRAQVEVYPHREVGWLERRLREVTARRRLIVTDAVFSMDGDLAPIKSLADLASKYHGALMVDEAHAVGVIGAHGDGLCAANGVRADFRMGTLGKALGSAGAFVLCETEVREWLINQSRPLIFSTSLPAATCAAAEAALTKLMTEPQLLERLRSNIRHFATGFHSLGLDASVDSAIFGVILGTPQRAMEADEALREQGVLAKAIRPPTVPKGTSRLRLAVSAAHTRAHLDHALEALGSLKKRGFFP